VVVSEIVDAALFGEGVMPSLHHAQLHLLAPNAVIIPRTAALLGVCVAAVCDLHVCGWIPDSVRMHIQLGCAGGP